jgi:hypothetical protein
MTGDFFHHRHLIVTVRLSALRDYGARHTRHATGATPAFPFSATFRQRAKIYLTYTRQANVPRTSLYRAMW